MDKVLLTIPDAALRLSLGRSKLYQLVQAGDLIPVRIGRAVRLATEDVDAYADKLRAEAQQLWAETEG